MLHCYYCTAPGFLTKNVCAISGMSLVVFTVNVWAAGSGHFYELSSVSDGCHYSLQFPPEQLFVKMSCYAKGCSAEGKMSNETC